MADQDKADVVAPSPEANDKKTDENAGSNTDTNDTNNVTETNDTKADDAQVTANGHDAANGVDKKEEDAEKLVEELKAKEEALDAKADQETEAAGEANEAEANDQPEEAAEEVTEEAQDDEPSHDQSVADVTMADSIADTTTDSIDAGDAADFPPGSVVLAKVKGFPAWPGMVVPENVLPSSVLDAKPRKNRQMWPVRFFIDTTHTWAYRNDLKPLGVDEAAKFLKSASRGRKDKSLHAAYKVASEPPSLDDFVEQVYGDAEDEDEEDEEDEEEAEEKPPAKKRKTAAKPAAASATSSAKSKAAAVKEAISQAKKKSGHGAAKESKEDAKAKGGAKADAKAGSKSASASPALSASKPKSSPAPRRSDKEGKVLVIRHKLQRGLLSGSVPEDSELPGLSQYLTRLEEFEGLETSIIRQTKINKVLKGIVKLESVPKDEEYGFKERSLKLLTEWNKLE
ncbi:PWWP domain-containing protein 1 [Yarrowia sp. B02]|nr:PWWP domain-containing protein 1 [Yarrowia sp. B02]